jgi:hypothetical protein
MMDFGNEVRLIAEANETNGREDQGELAWARIFAIQERHPPPAGFP